MATEAAIRNRPSFALLDIDLASGESVAAEAGALVSKSGGVEHGPPSVVPAAVDS